MNQFWDQNSLDFNDELNHVIWSESPSHQMEIQHPNELQVPGSIGAQQAMIGQKPLPWVPDIVGKEWQSPQSIFVVGSAYAGFVKRVFNTTICDASRRILTSGYEGFPE